jgi:hypothetical protein
MKEKIKRTIGVFCVVFAVILILLALLGSIYSTYEGILEKEALRSYVLSHCALDSIRISNLEYELDYWKASYYDCNKAYDEKIDSNHIDALKLRYWRGHGHIQMLLKVRKVN